MAHDYKTALVTGASSGMGKEFAHRLLKEGMTVYAAARSVDKMQDLKEAGAIILPMDITKDEDIAAAVDKIIGGDGGVDVLINNAGFALYGAVEETSVDAARHQFEVNLFGLARLTQLLLPSMRIKGKALIINVSSMGGKMYTPLGAWYHATKHALEGWSDCLRIELEPHGIDVVILEPGFIRTEFGDVMSQNFKRGGSGAYDQLSDVLEKAARESYERNTGRRSRPAYIADVVVKAVRARRPSTRYARGTMGPEMMFLRRLLPDRWFDRILMSQVK